MKRFLAKDLLNGLLTTPEWARERLEGLEIKRIAVLLHNSEQQVRDLLVFPGYDIVNDEHAKQLDRAVRAIKSDLNEHDCYLA